MTFEEELGLVVETAIRGLDFNRRGPHKSAILRMAHEVDRALNANTSTNRRFETAYPGHKPHPGGGDVHSYLREGIEASRLGRAAGCKKADCRICKRGEELERDRK